MLMGHALVFGALTATKEVVESGFVQSWDERFRNNSAAACEVSKCVCVCVEREREREREMLCLVLGRAFLLQFGWCLRGMYSHLVFQNCVFS